MVLTWFVVPRDVQTRGERDYTAEKERVRGGERVVVKVLLHICGKEKEKYCGMVWGRVHKMREQ